MDERAQALIERCLTDFRASGPGHRNCAQSVLLFALRLRGEDDGAAAGAVELARYLGGGLGRAGLTCGALTGAALALGLRDRDLDPALGGPQDAAREGLQTLARDFAARLGATDCRALTGCDLTSSLGRVKFAAAGVAEKVCVPAVRLACERLSALGLARPGEVG
ncbi:MAG TPA: C-GCAxxG-C-C family protein [Myxococcota bacterium]|nr:C-GCAxxG-C-C family protein [Myxococcota bacterium]HRY93724.1 C-GCAxxG-C-C family protein [Myxococcota bacterium]HSA21926.1 C-GCAxxG-C-C family protein [Myxococcota bacterium]